MHDVFTDCVLSAFSLAGAIEHSSTYCTSFPMLSDVACSESEVLVFIVSLIGTSLRSLNQRCMLYCEPFHTSKQLFYCDCHPCREAVISRMVTYAWENGVLHVQLEQLAAQQMFSAYEMEFG